MAIGWYLFRLEMSLALLTPYSKQKQDFILPPGTDSVPLPLCADDASFSTPFQVLFVNDVEPSATQWSNLKKDSDVYFISSSPLNPVSIEMANVPMCSCVVMFADTSIGEDSMEPGMIDSGVVFAYRYLTSKHPTKAVKCLMEIVEDVNIDYLKDSTADGMRVYTQELFAQGAIYSRSIPTTLLVQAFYNEHILSVVAALLSSTRDYIAYNGASSALPSHQGAVVAQIPLAQEDCGRTFGGMYESLLRRGSLCLALFRCCGQHPHPTPPPLHHSSTFLIPHSILSQH